MLLPEDREEILSKYLRAACRKISNKFKKYVDLTRDDNLQEFEASIDEDVIDILAEVMVYEWLKPQMYSNELLESRLNTKDFTEFSPAKIIENIKNTNYIYHNFLIERTLYHVKHKKIKYLNDINSLYKNRYNFINNIPEEKYLKTHIYPNIN